jgi:hypothetical protein
MLIPPLGQMYIESSEAESGEILTTLQMRSPSAKTVDVNSILIVIQALLLAPYSKQFNSIPPLVASPVDSFMSIVREAIYYWVLTGMNLLEIVNVMMLGEIEECVATAEISARRVEVNNEEPQIIVWI